MSPNNFIPLAIAFLMGSMPTALVVGKAFKGGTEGALLAVMKKRFKTVRHAKPPSSRKESAETYVVAQGFREET